MKYSTIDARIASYYGGSVALYILATCYATMAAAGYLVECLFAALRIVPAQRDIVPFTGRPSSNYTTALNIVLLGLAIVLIWRFLRTGGPQMLRIDERTE